LPDLLATHDSTAVTARPLTEAFGRQIAFLRAVAAGAPRGTALQLRFTAESENGAIECHLLGAGRSAHDAEVLASIVGAALPPEYPLTSVATSGLTALLKGPNPNGFTTRHAVELRRPLDRIDPTVDFPDEADLAVLPWTWTPQAMLRSLELLRFQPGTTVLLVHAEPATLSPDGAVFLQDEIRRLIADLQHGQDNPLAIAVLGAYRRWLRLLPRGCLALRVLLASSEPLTPGFAESMSTDLTRSFEAGAESLFAAADIVVPSSHHELDACAALVDQLRAVTWREPFHPELAELLHLFDPLEANTAFRLPIAPRGGLAGIASQRMSSIGRGRAARATSGARALLLGTTTAGAPFELTEDDLRRHILVAGLPGFGKSSTVQLLLERAHEAGCQFLVIDPSKDDYSNLLRRIAAKPAVGGVTNVRIYRPTHAEVAFNPLAVPSGVEIFRHAGRVLAAFDAALSLSSHWPLGFIELSRAVYRLYEGVEQGGEQPTLRDLYRTVGHILRNASYSGEARGNLEGSLLGRLEYLATGPTGRALSGDASGAIPWADILSRPTLIELGAFAAPPERALIFGLLMAGLVSYREANPILEGPPHLTVLEEAHRVLRAGSSADAGVEVFVDAIAELRASGEGFVIVDQAPSLLHPGLMKLTGTKLAHRLVETRERQAMGATMVLEGAQLDDLARLGQQRAIGYAATSDSAELIEIEELPETLAGLPVVPKRASLAPGAVQAVIHCIGCPVMCIGRKGMEHFAAYIQAVDVRSCSADAAVVTAANVAGNAAEGYCLAASTAGVLHRDDAPARRDRIEALIRSYHRLQTKR
jgi:hypothetical protein